jgi:hypothetical protein
MTKVLRYVPEESRGCWVVRDTQCAAHKAEPFPHVGLNQFAAHRLAAQMNGAA